MRAGFYTFQPESTRIKASPKRENLKKSLVIFELIPGDDTDVPLFVDMSGHNTNFAAAWCDDPGTIGTDQTRLVLAK